MARRIHVYSGERGNEVIRRVRLWSNTDRGQSGGNGYQIRVGVATAGTDNVDWLGIWNQQDRGLTQNTPIDLTGLEDLNFPIEAGKVCVIEIVEYGTPAQDVSGLTIEWKFNRVGGLKDELGRRLEGDEGYARPRYIDKPLFSLGRHIPDQKLRSAVEPLESDLNGTGVTEWVLSVPLFPEGGVTLETEAVESANDSEAAPTAISGTGAVVLCSVVLTPPDTTKAYRLVAQGGCIFERGGAGNHTAALHIFDATGAAVASPGGAAFIRCPFGGQPENFSCGVESYQIAANQGATTVQLIGTGIVNGSGTITPSYAWLTARLVRDPYVVE